MASSTRGKAAMKTYFKEKKKTAAAGGKAPASRKSKATEKHVPIDFTDDFDENDQILNQFDMNMLYGPCLGMNRMERWERANKMGLNPPKEIESLLMKAKFPPNCLWYDRV